MPSSTATTVTLTEPAVATILAVVIVGERLTPIGWAGLAIIGPVLVILALAPANAAHEIHLRPDKSRPPTTCRRPPERRPVYLSEPAPAQAVQAMEPSLPKKGRIMSYRLIAIYNRPTDPEAFDAYYDTVHIPLAEQIPNLRKIIASKIASIDGSTPEHYLQAQLIFDSRDKALEALSSPPGQAAGVDLANFATGGASMFLVGGDLEVIPEAKTSTR